MTRIEADALERLYRERYGDFLRVAAAITGDAEAGRDAVQSAFATALRRRGSFRGDGPLEAWVWRIVVNEARATVRRRPGVARVESAPANGQPADDEAGVRAWVAALPERQRAAVFLRYFADLDYRSIAELLGVEVGTVSATLSAARTTLRRRLEEVER